MHGMSEDTLSEDLVVSETSPSVFPLCVVVVFAGLIKGVCGVV